MPVVNSAVQEAVEPSKEEGIMLKQLLCVSLVVFAAVAGCAAGMERDLDREGVNLDVVEGDVETESAGVAVQELHSSGICRIEKTLIPDMPPKKGVAFYHISDPEEIHNIVVCDLWVGTSKCCAQKNTYGLTYEDCKRLRHNPDCP